MCSTLFYTLTYTWVIKYNIFKGLYNCSSSFDVYHVTEKEIDTLPSKKMSSFTLHCLLKQSRLSSMKRCSFLYNRRQMVSKTKL